MVKMKGTARDIQSIQRNIGGKKVIGTSGTIAVKNEFARIRFESPRNNNEVIKAKDRVSYLPVEFEFISGEVHNLKVIKKNKGY